MSSLEKEYPILKEDRRRKESKNKNIRYIMILVVGLIAILIRFLF